MKPFIYLIAVLFISYGASLAQTPQPSPSPAAEDELPRFEVGVQYTSLSRSFNRNGVGGRFTYNFNKYVAAEAETNIFPGGDFNGSNVQGLFGVKIGKRWSKVGLFGKVRPGFLYSSKGRRGVFADSDSNLTFITDGTNDFAVDVGGVVEVYPSKKIFLRFDGGTLTTRSGGYVQNFVTRNEQTGTFENQSFSVPAQTSSRFQFSAGVGFRF